MAGKIQNEDVKSLSELTGAGGSVSQLPNDSKIYVSSNSLNDQLSVLLTSGAIANKEVASIAKKISTPANPASGYVKIYAKSDDQIYVLTSGGTETAVSSSVTASSTVTFTNKSLDTTTTRFVDTTTATKKLAVDLSGATASTTTTIAFAQTTGRTISFQDATDTVVMRATTDSLTNKNLVAGSTAIVDGSDATKKITFLTSGSSSGGSTQIVSAATAANVITLPNETTTLMGSKLTTKGDLLTFSTVNARLGVGSDGQVLTADATQTLGVKWAAVSATGTVTSVAVTVPSFLSASGSPVTTSGTIAITLATETANTVFAGPTSGGAATPTFRALVAADIPTITSLFIGTAQTSNSVSTDTTFQEPSNAPSITFTPTVSGKYKIWCSLIHQGGTSGNEYYARLQSISGSPTSLQFHDSAFNAVATNEQQNVEVWRIDTLVAGTSYSYKVYMKGDTGTGTLNNSLAGNGTAIVAQRLE